MKTLYLECNMGAAGDMLLASLLGLFENPAEEIVKLNALGVPKVEYVLENAEKCGIRGLHVRVLTDYGEESAGHEHHHDHHHEHEHHHHHHHTGMNEIEHIVSHLNVPDKVRTDILSVYNLIAEAESAAHGCDVSQIHFHEVGTLDAVADIAGVCTLIDELKPDRICASPICVGYGEVQCAHGILPVPAPATEHILRGVPIYAGDIEGELCTPTGAALLKYFADEFCTMPQMKITASGRGMGTKDFEKANCVRAFLGEEEGKRETVCEISCNVDDMTAEEIAFASERLFEAGAPEVFTTPVGMKKNRIGTLLTCIVREEDKEKIIRCIFKHTSTIGVRVQPCERYVLQRRIEETDTSFGKVRIKYSEGYGEKRMKAEYDDAAKIALEQNLSLREAREAIYNEIRRNEI